MALLPSMLWLQTKNYTSTPEDAIMLLSADMHAEYEALVCVLRRSWAVRQLHKA